MRQALLLEYVILWQRQQMTLKQILAFALNPNMVGEVKIHISRKLRIDILRY